MPVSIIRQSVSKNIVAANTVLLLSASIAGVALHGIDNTVLTFLHNAHMVAIAVYLPIEENEIAGAWLIAVVLPLSVIHEPLRACVHTLKVRDDPSFQIAALIGTP